MKKMVSIIYLLLMSSTAFAASEFNIKMFEATLRKNLAVGNALFDCVYEGKQISEIYENVGLIKSSNAVCRASMEKAAALGATREDFLKAIESNIQK